MGAAVVKTATQDKTVKRFRLAATAESVAAARAFTRATLSTWDLRHLVDDAALITSELMSNAVVVAPGEMVVLTLTHEVHALVIGVWDSSEKLPAPSPTDPLEESGRGLRIVAAISGEHGIDRAENGGKTVWARMKI
jgi:anti-sigma regulatory factor (Ser/Thr protein kinase)